MGKSHPPGKVVLFNRSQVWYNNLDIAQKGSESEEKRLRILGIDPGYAIVGYGVVEVQGGRYRPVEYGAVTTQPGNDFGLRLKEIYEGMAQLLRQHQPQAAAVEKLYFTNNKTTGIGVAEARGVLLLALSQAGVPLFEYTPMQVKQAVTGYGKAVKKQVQEMTRMLLNLPAVPKPDDTADALAMAITFCHTNGNQLNRFTRRVAGPI